MKKILKFLSRHVIISAFTIIFSGAALVVLIEKLGPFISGFIFLIFSFVWPVIWYILIGIGLVILIRYVLDLKKLLKDLLGRLEK